MATEVLRVLDSDREFADLRSWNQLDFECLGFTIATARAQDDRFEKSLKREAEASCASLIHLANAHLAAGELAAQTDRIRDDSLGRNLQGQVLAFSQAQHSAWLHIEESKPCVLRPIFIGEAEIAHGPEAKLCGRENPPDQK